MHKFFITQQIEKELLLLNSDEISLFCLTKETSNEKRYFLVNKKSNNNISIEDVTIEEVIQRGERALPLNEAIVILTELNKGIAKDAPEKPGCRYA